eukprot:270202_1
MTERWQITMLSLVSVVAIICCVICIYTVYSVCFKITTMQEDRKAIYVTLICLLFHGINANLDPFGFYFYAISSNNSVQTRIYNAWSGLWTLSKLSLYLVYIYRLYVTFHETPYSYSYVIYFPISCIIMLQCVVMVFYISVRNEFDEDSNLALISSCVFILFDFILIIVIMILFIVPISKLIKQLKSNAQNIIVPNLFNMDGFGLKEDEKEISQLAENSMDFAIMSKTLKEPKHNWNDTPTTNREKEFISLSASFQHQGGEFVSKNDTIDNSHNTFSTTHRYGSMEVLTKRLPKWNFKQQLLLAFATRLLLLAVICLVSSFFYQMTWIISIVTDHKLINIYWFTYTWNIDMLINIICLFLSFPFANRLYEKLCIDTCQCHQSCTKIVGVMI